MKVNILGVEIDNITLRDLLAKVESFWKDEKKHYIVTPNPEFIVYAQKDKKFKEILNLADLSIPDGVGVLWASRVLDSPIGGRLAGADVAEELVKLAAKTRKTVFFLGGKGDVANLAAKKMRELYPELKVIGSAPGNPGSELDSSTREYFPKESIDLLLVAYGHPKQEYWIQRNISKINAKVAMGVGGTFDYWSGRVRRAPFWVRNIGLEWLYRLIREPRRLRRQLALPAFIWLVLKKAS